MLETRPVLLDCYKVLYVVAGQPQNRSANRPSLAEAVEGGCPALDLLTMCLLTMWRVAAQRLIYLLCAYLLCAYLLCAYLLCGGWLPSA